MFRAGRRPPGPYNTGGVHRCGKHYTGVGQRDGRYMVSRRVTVLLAGLVLASGLSVVGGAVVDAPPTFTVTNTADTPHQVTTHTAESLQSAMLMNFAVTTESGDRRLVTLSQLVWPEGFRNVTLADRDVPTQEVTIEPGEETTTTIGGWTPGDVTVYIVEDLGDDETHVLTEIETCAQRQQTHTLTIEEDGFSGSSICASSYDWLLLD